MTASVTVLPVRPLADRAALPDVQAESPARALALGRVGVCGVKLPLELAGGRAIATLDLAVDLPATQRGVHMSRFRRAVDGVAHGLDPQEFADVLARELLRVHSYATHSEVTLTTERALGDLIVPATARSRMGESVEIAATGARSISFRAIGSTVCPCALAMSGGQHAHVQRAELQLELFDPRLPFAQIHALCTNAFSAPVAMVLDRPAEKALVERMFAHPRFVEDVAREAVAGLRAAKAGAAARIVATAYESIHPYDCFAAWEGSLT